MSTIHDQRRAVRVTNTTESPYPIKEHTQIAEFSVVTPEQSKHKRPVEMAILSMIPQGDHNLTAYLCEFLGMKKPEQQDSTSCFPTPENDGKPWDHTPKQTRILKELTELKEKDKLNQQDNKQSRNEFLKWFDGTDKLTEPEKQAIEDILVNYRDNFARNRLDIGMNTEFKVKSTAKNDKAVFSQSLPMPIHLKEDLIVEMAPKNKYGISFHFFITLHFLSCPDHPTSFNINAYNREEEKQFHTANEEQITADRGYKAGFKIADGTTAVMATHLGKQERFFDLAHCAVTFSRIAGGPKRH